MLGDSITMDGRWVAGLAAWMEERGIAADVINVGLSSETTSGLTEVRHAKAAFPRPDLFDRLDSVLRVTSPDLVIAMYGMNCGSYLPLDEGRFARFRQGMERLHATVEKAGAKIVHLTPPVYDKQPGNAGPAGEADYDAVLTAYGEWLLAKRADGWAVIDVHGPMKAALHDGRRSDPDFTFTPDCIHPNNDGHWVICRAVIGGLGDEAAAADPALPTMLGPFLPDVTRRMKVLRDAYREAAGHTRPGMPPGLPIAVAETEARRLTESIRSRRLQLRGTKDASGEWRMAVEWPRPPPIDPGPAAERAAPIPGDAVALFDGGDMSAWQDGGNWRIADGIVTVGDGQIVSKQAFGDCHVHVEFRVPSPSAGSGQERGESGILLMGKYKISVADSWAEGADEPATDPDVQCGALYKQRPPAMNACRRRGEWQTYEILFTCPRFGAKSSLESPGRIGVLHNGIAIHSDTVIHGETFRGRPPSYAKHPDALPMTIQVLGDSVQVRSMWVRRVQPLTPRALPR